MEGTSAARARIGVLALLVLAACTRGLVVGPEGQFSWGTAGPLVWPLRGIIASPFGDSNRSGGHQGIDLAARPGDVVAAAQAGRVAFVGPLPGYDLVVVLDHSSHLSTVYAHLGESSVRTGGSLAQGETIGKLGAVGYLHFEIRDGKRAIDPMTVYAVAPSPIPGGSVDVSDRLAEEAGPAVPVDGAPAAVAAAPHVPPSPAPTAPPVPHRPTPRALAPAPPPSPTPHAPAGSASAGRRFSPEEIPEPAAPPAPTAAPSSALVVSRPVPPAVDAAGGEGSADAETAPGLKPPAEPSSEFAAGLGLAVQLFVTNVLYVPVKVAYAGVGAITGGMVLVLSQNPEVAQRVWQRTMGGDYVVAAEHLHGDVPLHFIGEEAEASR